MLLATRQGEESELGACSWLPTKEQAIDRSDGWSKRRVEGSSVLSWSLNHVDSSVAPMESSPPAMSDTSAETAVPVNSVTVSRSLLKKLSNKLVG